MSKDPAHTAQGKDANTTGTAAPPPDRVRLPQLLAFAVGGLPFDLGANAVKQLAYPIYNIVLGVNPALLGAMLMIARIWDACTDPIMGWISDNTRTRWGRRRPYIAAGAVLCAICFPLIWWVPRGAGHGLATTYFCVTALAFYTAFTVYCVPYVTLAFEMSPNYNERTRIFAVRNVFTSLAGLVGIWAFRAAYWDGFDDAVQGIRVVGLAIGGMFLVCGLCPALFTNERYMRLVKDQVKLKFFPSFKHTFANRPFRILLTMTLTIIFGVFTFDALGVYVNTYYVCGGDVKQAATLMGLSGTVRLFCTWAYLPIVTMLSARVGKVNALRFCLGMGILASISKWFLFRPEWPYMQLLLPILISPASSGFWLLVNSMKADVCDLDELESGVRREGAYAAISSWVQKFAASLTFLLTGLVLVVTGFQQSLGGDQSAGTLLMLRLAFCIMPATVFTIGLIMLRKYDLGPARMKQIRADLEGRRMRV